MKKQGSRIKAIFMFVALVVSVFALVSGIKYSKTINEQVKFNESLYKENSLVNNSKLLELDYSVYNNLKESGKLDSLYFFDSSVELAAWNDVVATQNSMFFYNFVFAVSSIVFASVFFSEVLLLRNSEPGSSNSKIDTSTLPKFRLSSAEDKKE